MHFRLNSIAQLMLLLLSVSGCTKIVSIASSLDTHAHLDHAYCYNGQHACVGFADLPFFDSEIRYQFSFDDGTDYQTKFSPPNTQVNKLFGSTDCGTIAPATTDAAMIGFRHLAGTNQIELLGYAHNERNMANGLDFRYSHLLTVPRYQTVNLGIRVLNGYYSFRANSNDEVIMERFCSQGIFDGRIIDTWFGGAAPAPQDMEMKINDISKMPAGIPQNLSIADHDGTCGDIADPIANLKNHPSGIYAQYQGQCSKTLKVVYGRCSYSENPTTTQRTVYQYTVQCQ